jgi:hypothetical protein
MKVFTEQNGYWESKVNFIDDNDVFIGYNMAQCCCEHADWFVANKIAKVKPSKLNQPDELKGYNFDIEFFEELDYLAYEDCNSYNALDEGGVAVFKITKGNNEKYLHLFNCHNGYYGHGFEVKHGGEIVNDGVL